jgi:hypothetical protein
MSGVTDARRAFLEKEWREATAEDGAIKITSLLAVQTEEETLFAAAADAQVEALRRQTLRSIPRHRYNLVVQLNDDTDALDLGDVVTPDRVGAR